MPAPVHQPVATKPEPQPKRNKLSYKDQRELEELPGRIEGLEQAIQTIHDRMAEPGFYQQNGDTIASTKDELAILETKLEQAYARWETLDQS